MHCSHAYDTADGNACIGLNTHHLCPPRPSLGAVIAGALDAALHVRRVNGMQWVSRISGSEASRARGW